MNWFKLGLLEMSDSFRNEARVSLNRSLDWLKSKTDSFRSAPVLNNAPAALFQLILLVK